MKHAFSDGTYLCALDDLQFMFEELFISVNNKIEIVLSLSYSDPLFASLCTANLYFMVNLSNGLSGYFARATAENVPLYFPGKRMQSYPTL